MIDSFSRRYSFLSNFYACTVSVGMHEFPSSEHAFQCAKTLSEEERESILAKKTAKAAKKAGRAVTLRADWESVKVGIMRSIVHAKFSQNEKLKTKLLATGTEELVERNTWGDQFWGVDGEGENHLGKILMEVRTALAPAPPTYEESLQGLTVKRLRELLKEKGLEVGGTKKKLAERLVGAPDAVSVAFDENGSEVYEYPCSECKTPTTDLYPLDMDSPSTACLACAKSAGSPEVAHLDDNGEEFSLSQGIANVVKAFIPNVEKMGAAMSSPKPHSDGVVESADFDISAPKPAYVPDPTKNRTIPPDVLTTKQRVYDYYKRKNEEEGYTGQTLSVGQLGEDCSRKLWYMFRWAAEADFPGRLLRMFRRGDAEEELVIEEWRAIGLQVWDKRSDVEGFHKVYQLGGELHVYNPAGEPVKSFAIAELDQANAYADKINNKQIRSLLLDGHMGGRLDSVVKGFEEAPKTVHVGEIKNVNAKKLEELKKKGLEKAQPKHYTQIMIYMHTTGINRGMYWASCKNDDHIYSERVYYDQAKAIAMIEKAERIIRADSPPDRIGDKPDFWKCKYCDFKEICHYDALPAVNCRTCVHATPVLDGSGRDLPLWNCENGGEYAIPRDRQELGCSRHLYIPPLLEPLEYVGGCPPEYVEYKAPGGARVFNIIDGDISADTAALRTVGTVWKSWELKSLPIDTSTDFAKLRVEIPEIPF